MHNAHAQHTEYDIASLYMISFYCFVTEACARRPGAATSVEHRQCERRTLLTGSQQASRSDTLVARQAFECMHILCQHMGMVTNIHDIRTPARHRKLNTNVHVNGAIYVRNDYYTNIIRRSAYAYATRTGSAARVLTPARSPLRANVACAPRLRQRQSFGRTLLLQIKNIGGKNQP